MNAWYIIDTAVGTGNKREAKCSPFSWNFTLRSGMINADRDR